MADSANSPENSSISDTIPATKPKFDGHGSAGLREDLVNTAVKFLQSAKVRETPVEYRKAFLAKKGLMEAEIHEAINRAGPSALESSMTPYPHQNVMAPPPPRPLPLTWRDYAQTMMFVSGASYVAFKFVRGYLLPTWFNVPDPEQERIRRLDENMNEVQNGLKFLVDSVQQTLGVVQQQQETLNRLVNQMIEKDKTAATQERAVQELKTEVATIKSLLLSRDQFPPLPSASSGLPGSRIPTIPSWQRALPNNSHPQLANGNVKNGPFTIGSDGDEEDMASRDGIGDTEVTYTSMTTGSENGEKMTPV